MLNEKQKDDFIAFVGCFLCAVHEHNAPREQAEIMLRLAVSALLGAVFRVEPDEVLKAFAVQVMSIALQREYAA